MPIRSPRRTRGIIKPLCLLSALLSFSFHADVYSEGPSEYEKLIEQARQFDCGVVPGDRVDREKAVKFYLAAADLEPDNPRTVDALLRVGQLYICNFNPDRGETYEPEKALEAFKKIIEMHDKREERKYWPNELRGLIFLGESCIATRHYDLAIETFCRFFSIDPSQVEFAPHEWDEILEKDREEALDYLRGDRYQELKSIVEEHVRMVVGSLNDPVHYATLGMLQKRYPNATLLPASPPQLDDALLKSINDFSLAPGSREHRKDVSSAQTPTAPKPTPELATPPSPDRHNESRRYLIAAAILIIIALIGSLTRRFGNWV